MNEIYLSIGGNIGDREKYLGKAVALLEKYCGPIIRRSAIYETAAWGKTDQQDFLNQVLLLQSSLQPQALMKEILAIEKQMGRERTEKNGPRIIDIDILFYNDLIIDQPGLIVPHPRISDRRFVLLPLTEIAETLPHPVIKKTIRQLLNESSDRLPVTRYVPSNEPE